MATTIRAFGWAVLSASMVVSAPAMAADAAPAADVARLQGDVDRLKQELAAQRQLILQLMQAEQQRYDVVLKYLQAGGAPSGDLSSAFPPPPSPSVVMPKSTAGGDGAGPGSGGSGHEAATVTGRVKTGAGQSLGEAYVYVDGLRS